MDKVFLTFIFFIGFSRTSLGLPVLMCSDVDPSSTSTVQCSCYNPGGLGIELYRDGNYITQCTILNLQCFNATGYTFSINSSATTYTMDFGLYSYTTCSKVTCNDLSISTDVDLKTISVDESILTPTISAISEPAANHTNGNISFTTDCLYKARSTNMTVTAKWIAVTGNGEHVLQVDETISEIGSCQSCSYDFASKFMIEFYHKEYQSEDKEEAKIRLELLIDENPVSSLRKTTHNMYYVKGKNESSVSNNVTFIPNSATQSTSAIQFMTTTSGRNVKSDPTPANWCGKHCTCIIILIIVACICAIYLIVHAIILCCKCKILKENKGFAYCCLFVPIYGLIKIHGIKCKEGRTTTSKGGQIIPFKTGTTGQDPSSKKDTDRVPYLKEEKQVSATVSTDTHMLNIKADQKRKLEILDIAEKYIDIQWKRCKDENFRSYVLTYAEAEREKTIDCNGKDYIECTLTDLNESTSYNLSLSCFDEFDQLLDLKERHDVRINEPNEDEELHIASDSHKDKKITWRNIYVDDDISPRKFVLKYSGVKKDKEISDDGKSYRKYKLTGLNKSTSYVLSLICVDEYKHEIRHLKFEPSKCRTRGCPEPPKEVELVKRTGKGVYVKWKPGNDGGFKQTFLLIDAQTDEKLTEPIKCQFKEVEEHFIPIVKRNTDLKLRVMSVNIEGSSESSVVYVPPYRTSTQL